MVGSPVSVVAGLGVPLVFTIPLLALEMGRKPICCLSHVLLSNLHVRCSILYGPEPALHGITVRSKPLV